MGWLFSIFAFVTVAGAVAAVGMRQLIHGALCLAVSFVGLALIYLHLGAQFIGFAQVLVYVGAVAILLVFAILLTRGVEATQEGRWTRFPAVGGGIAGLVFVALVVAVLASDVGRGWPDPKVSVAEDAAVIRIGVLLMTEYVVPLLVIGVLLTVALIGGVLIAMEEGREGPKPAVAEGSEQLNGVPGDEPAAHGKGEA
jgi:NADH-quinone oxidoreductase subunit J